MITIIIIMMMVIITIIILIIIVVVITNHLWHTGYIYEFYKSTWLNVGQFGKLSTCLRLVGCCTKLI